MSGLCVKGLESISFQSDNLIQTQKSFTVYQYRDGQNDSNKVFFKLTEIDESNTSNVRIVNEDLQNAQTSNVYVEEIVTQDADEDYAEVVNDTLPMKCLVKFMNQFPFHSIHYEYHEQEKDSKLIYYGSTHSTNFKNIHRDDLQQKEPLLPVLNRSMSCPFSLIQEQVGEVSTSQAAHMDIPDNEFVILELGESIQNKSNFPKEKLKTLVAAIMMTIGFLLTLLSLSLVHERVPDRNKHGPLPDVLLDRTPPYDWALDVSEYIIMISINSVILMAFLHKHRYIVFRRIFAMLSLLYLYRAVTMYITVLPIASKTYLCSPKSAKLTTVEVVTRMWTLFWGFGLAVSGKYTYCGDFIYSGHTAILVFCYLVIAEYIPGRLWIINWIYWFLAGFGILMLMLSHGHYSIDIILAYFLTTRLFWIYHTLANNTSLKQYSSTNFLSRAWWFEVFLYFEKNVDGLVPNEFEWPLSWPRGCH
ncbi:unnamed protein product [Phaedon cochleariae]|uniref:Sphingomyelin synthase-like domain-containing protein n=1 Tax=Phaedon cochleariae TaxID=80249 RepID=A0A9P0DI09_PHACE|nr:unnamed protein product [Phaedon cochleariae]